MVTPNLVLPTASIAPTREHRPKSKSLAALIAKLNAAVDEVDKWSTREDALSLEFRKAEHPQPKVKGGVTEPYTLVRNGKTVADEPASDWFYRSREDIEKDQERAIFDAKSDDELSQIQTRFAALLADWDAQAATYERKRPRGHAHAKRMLNRAHRAWSGAEDQIVNYRPRNLEEVIELMAYAGRDEMKGVFFTPDEGQLKFMMRNVAEILGKLEARS